jgi:hypothetical protein
MPNRFLFTLGFIALAGAAQAPAAAKIDRFGRTVTASVGSSEWGPPGQVSLDLATGRYRLTAAVPRQGAPAGRSGPGRLDRVRLQRVRDAVRAARDGGLTERACSAGGPPPRLVISNAAGPIVLELDGPGRRMKAPRDRGCWTPGAMRLQRVMEDIFGPLARPRRRPL